MEGDFEHLISEATKLLGEASSLKKTENHTEGCVSSSDHTRESDLISDAEDAVGMGTARRRVAGENEKTDPKTEEAESHRPKNKSTERDFWFKLAEQSF
jgi:hypothetical protein